MKRWIFWIVFCWVAITILGEFAFLAVSEHVHVEHDIAKNFQLKKAGWTVPTLHGAMLPAQCGAAAGLGRRGQWVCANEFYGSAAGELENKGVWGKHLGINSCAFFRAHLRLLEQTEFDSPSDWHSFQIGLAACMTV